MDSVHGTHGRPTLVLQPLLRASSDKGGGCRCKVWFLPPGMTTFRNPAAAIHGHSAYTAVFPKLLSRGWAFLGIKMRVAKINIAFASFSLASPLLASVSW